MVARIWLVMKREYPANSVFIQVQSERKIDLLGDAGTAISWITPFHRNDGINEFSGWTLWTSLLTATR